MGVAFIVTAIALYSACLFFLIENTRKEEFASSSSSFLGLRFPIACFDCPDSIDPNAKRMMKLTTVTSNGDNAQCYYFASKDETCAAAVNGMSAVGTSYGLTSDEYAAPTKMCTYSGPSTCPLNDTCKSSDTACIPAAPCSTSGKKTRTYSLDQPATNGGKKGCPATDISDCTAPTCVPAVCTHNDTECVATALCSTSGKRTRTYTVSVHAGSKRRRRVSRDGNDGLFCAGLRPMGVRK